MCNVAFLSYIFFVKHLFFLIWLSFAIAAGQYFITFFLLIHMHFVSFLLFNSKFLQTQTLFNTHFQEEGLAVLPFFLRDNDIRISFYNYFKYYILFLLLLHCEPQRPTRFNIEDFLTLFYCIFLLKNNPRKKKKKHRRDNDNINMGLLQFTSFTHNIQVKN